MISQCKENSRWRLGIFLYSLNINLSTRQVVSSVLCKVLGKCQEKNVFFRTTSLKYKNVCWNRIQEIILDLK